MTHEAIQYVAIVQLVMHPQVRKRASREVVDGMAKTIKRLRGLLSPLRVRRLGDKYVVVDGHLRLLAAAAADLEQVPCIIEERDLSEAEVAERQLIANRRREDLRPIEFAEAVAELMKATQCTLSELADRLGESAPTLSRSLSLLTLPETIKAKIEAGEISASAAYKLTHVSDGKRQAGLAAELASGQLTRDGLNGKLKAGRKSNGKRHAEPRADRIKVNLGGGRSLVFCGRGAASLEIVVSWLDELLAKAKAAVTDGMTLDGFLKCLNDGKDR